MRSVCVFCGSSPGKDPYYLKVAGQLGKILAKRQITLIYGGASVGIMGALAEAALAGGGKVIGVIPEFLAKKEIRHEGLTQLITVKSMHQRKQQMVALAEGFMALPGGFGTLEELCEILTWSQLGLVSFPVGILNVRGYFDGLLSLFDHMVDQQFLKYQTRDLVLSDGSVDGLLNQMTLYQPRDIRKWIDSAIT